MSIIVFGKFCESFPRIIKREGGFENSDLSVSVKSDSSLVEGCVFRLYGWGDSRFM